MRGKGQVRSRSHRKTLLFGILSVVAVSVCSLLWLLFRFSSFRFQHRAAQWARAFLYLPHDGFYSQHGQDRWVNDYISRRGTAPAKVFVEFGANDGLTHSNTAYFESVLGFRGLCAEPNQKNFEQLQRNRPSCFCVHAAIGECLEGSNRSFVEFTQDVVDPKTGKHTDPSGLNGFSDSYDSGLMKSQCDYFGCKHIAVPCRSLQSALDAAHIDRIDYMAVDTEGSELEALRSMDWAKMHGGPLVVQIEVGRVVTENVLYEPTKNEIAIHDFMNKKGYVFAAEFTGTYDFTKRSRDQDEFIKRFPKGANKHYYRIVAFDLIFVHRRG